MPWYYYSGKTVRPIPVKRGLSKAVRPGKSIEILEMTVEASALIRKRELRLTGKPKGAESVAEEPVPTVKIEDVIEKSPMAKAIAEKGVTVSAGIPPKSKGGHENTELEEMVDRKITVGTDVPVEGDVAKDDVMLVDGDKKGKKSKRRRL